MEKLAIQLGRLGSILGVLAGIVELSIGNRILPWIGNKENPTGLGLVTIFLSGMAYFSVRSARNQVMPTNNRKLAIFLGVLLPATICFTSVGRLWYLPGLLLLITSLLLANRYWFQPSGDDSPAKNSSKFRWYSILGGMGSLLILASVGLAFSISSFGLFQSNILVEAGLIRFQVLPMDIVRLNHLSATGYPIQEFEVSLVMFVYIFLISGSAIALIASLADSWIFRITGGAMVLLGLVLFLVEMPGIFRPTGLPELKFLNLLGFLGSGWYISILGVVLILIASLFQFRSENPKS
jgi:hypothetical protein